MVGYALQLSNSPAAGGGAVDALFRYFSMAIGKCWRITDHGCPRTGKQQKSTYCCRPPTTTRVAFYRIRPRFPGRRGMCSTGAEGDTTYGPGRQPSMITFGYPAPHRANLPELHTIGWSSLAQAATLTPLCLRTSKTFGILGGPPGISASMAVNNCVAKARVSEAAAASIAFDPSGGSYQRRRPETTLLYQLIEKYYPVFVEHLERSGRTLPRYV